MNVYSIKTPTVNYRLNTNPANKTGTASYSSFGRISLPNLMPRKDTYYSSFDLAGDTIYDKSRKILEKHKTFSNEEYKKLSINEINILRKTISDPDIKEDFGPILSVYKILKKNLSKKYPNGYIFVSIGTSPAFFAKMLQLDGQDVKYCPCVTLRRDFKKIPKDFIKSYSSYLKSIGITKEAINNSDKPFIFVDYTATGRSLENFEKLLKDNRIGINKSEKVDFVSINKDLLKEDNNKNINHIPFLPYKLRMQKFVNDYFNASEIKKYSPVPKISDDETEISQYIKDCGESYRSKLMSFHMIDYNERNKNVLRRLFQI